MLRLEVWIAIAALLAIGEIILFVLYRKLGRLVLAVRDTKPKEVTPAMIKAWKKRMKLYPVGSAKYRAYQNSLKRAGALDGD